VRARFGKALEEDVRDRLVTRAFREASSEKGLEPLGRPELEEVFYQEGQPFRLRTSFDVLPRIEVRGHRGVEVRRPSGRLAEGEVDRALEEIRQSRVRLVTEPDREARPGDVVVADVAGEPSEGEPFARERAAIEVGFAGNPPGFDQALTGVRSGVRPEFTASYPQDHRDRRLAGQTVAFRILVHEVKRREVPDLDDELAKDLGLESLAELRRQVTEDLTRRRGQEADGQLRRSLLDKILLANPVVLPEALVDQEVRSRLEEFARGLVLQGVDLEKANVDWDEARRRQEEPARKSVHARLILDAIARAESIEVDRADVERRIEQDARRLGEDPKRLKRQLAERSGFEALRTQMVREKTLDYLTGVANILNEE
jgi:trigger factor